MGAGYCSPKPSNSGLCSRALTGAVIDIASTQVGLKSVVWINIPSYLLSWLWTYNCRLVIVKEVVLFRFLEGYGLGDVVLNLGTWGY